MKSIRIILAITTALLFTPCLAKVVTWSVAPNYAEIKPYTQTLYLASVNGKWGLIDGKGTKVLDFAYDFITKPSNGTGIAGTTIGGRYLIKSLISSDGLVVNLQKEYYVAGYTAFSEGLLPVSNKSGKVGYIDAAGNEVVRCRFTKGHPFTNGYASVVLDKWVYYIRQNFDANQRSNVLHVNYKNGEINFGTPFINGEAVVGYLDDFCIIDAQGNKRRDISQFQAKEFLQKAVEQLNAANTAELKYNNDIHVINVGSKMGYSYNNTRLCEPIFQFADKFTPEGFAIAKADGNYGILKLIEGDIMSQVIETGNPNNAIIVDRDGKVSSVTCQFQLPQGLDAIQLFCDRGDGTFVDMSSSVTKSNNVFSVPITPHIANNANMANLQFKLMAREIPIYSSAIQLPVEYPITIRLQAPYATSNQADVDTEIQTIVATIHNDSNRPTEVVATMALNGHSHKLTRSFVVNIPANSSKHISMDVKVITNEEVTCTVSLDSGERKTSRINLKGSY